VILVLAAAATPSWAVPPTVAINEVHYHPADDSRESEFVELLNFGQLDVDISGWGLSGGVTFLFPPGTVVPVGGFLVVAADRGRLLSLRGLDPALVAGSYGGTLDNAGELLELRTAGGYLASFVDFGDSDPWPETPDGLGPSLERLSPLREEGDAQAWAASIAVGGTPGAPNSVRTEGGGGGTPDQEVLIPAGADWRFFRGATAPPANWAGRTFNDAAWEEGPAGFGYGDGDDATEILDMEGNYLTVFVRRSFSVDDLDAILALTLVIDYDDGFVAFLNGVEVARQNVDATGFDQAATGSHEAGAPESFAVDPGLLVAGANVLAVSGHNAGAASSDFSLAPALSAVVESSGPGPGPSPQPPPRDLVVNELAPVGTATGWVELYNPTAGTVDASGRRLLAFGVELGDHALAAGTTLAAGARRTVSEAQLGFELDGAPALILATADGRFIDALNPRTTRPTESVGRFPDGADNRFVFTAPTPGSANTFAAERRVVINEIHYHPSDSNAAGEWIELHNASGAAIDVSGWALTRGVDYTFPGGTVLAPGAYLVIAKDPRTVEAYYGIAGVLGPFAGGLRNDAETLLLRDALGNPADRVRYADEGSWPPEADGLGPSLELVNPAIENRYGPSWAASSGEGTPGARNSAFAADPVPVVAGVEHQPVVPASSQRVRVLAAASDERPLSAVTLFWEVDGSGAQPSQVSMVDDGVLDDGVAANGVWGAEIPPRADRSVVAFWIRADAAGGQSATAPSGAPQRAFLYQVQNSTSEEARPLYRVVMRAAALTNLRGNINSDALRDLTFVADGRAYYNRGIRHRGSSARSCNPLSYRVEFDHDTDFHGIQRLILNGCDVHRQWIGLDFLLRSGVPAPLTWFRRVAFNGQPESNWHLRVEATDEEFLERNFPLDADGNLYRGLGQANLDYRGQDFDDYRGDYSKETNEEEDDWGDVVDLCFRFDDQTTSDADFPAAVEERVDVYEWTLFFAAFAVLGSSENSILLNNGDDYFLYHRFSDDRWMLLPWDLDSSFDEADQVLFRPTVNAIERFLEHPRYAPDYWCHLANLLEHAFQLDQVDARIDHLAPLFAGGVLAPLRAFASARRSYIAARLESTLDAQVASGGSLCRGVLFADANRVLLSGSAPGCGTAEVVLNGFPAAYDPLTNQWSGSVDLAGIDVLSIRARSRDGFESARLDISVDPPPDSSGGETGPVHEQGDGESFLAVQAADFQEIGDPDGDGNVWGLASGVGGALGRGGSVLRAPQDGNFRQVNQSHAVYRLRFRQAGTYRSYFRARGFSNLTDSIFRPAAFNRDPDVNLVTSQSGAFGWVNEGDFTVTAAQVAAGAVLEFRVGVREFETEIDGFVLSTSTSLNATALNGLLSGADAGSGPRVRIQAQPGTQLTLRRGSATVTLDGSGSHDGHCGSDRLAFFWERVDGVPGGDAFLGDLASASVGVAFSLAGTYVYRLNVVNLDAAGAESSAEVTVVVSEPVDSAFQRCDSNGDGENTVSDPIFTLLRLFAAGAAADCAAALDCNGDAAVDLADAVFDLRYLFLGGQRPPAPFPACENAALEACELSTCIR
jgi:hypothetical protein